MKEKWGPGFTWQNSSMKSKPFNYEPFDDFYALMIKMLLLYQEIFMKLWNSIELA